MGKAGKRFKKIDNVQLSILEMSFLQHVFYTHAQTKPEAQGLGSKASWAGKVEKEEGRSWLS